MASLMPPEHIIRIFRMHRPVSYLIKLKLRLKSYKLNDKIKCLLNSLAFLGKIFLNGK